MSPGPGRASCRRRRGPPPLRRRASGRGAGALALLAGALLATACTLESRPEAEVGDPAADRPGSDTVEIATEIREMLRSSARSWNAGDLEGFLDDYADDPGLTFSGGPEVTRGKAAVRERYLASYWAPGASRDSLRFEELEVRPLGSGHALVLGRYVLYRPSASDSVTATGPFTLVLRRSDGSWRIIHDHSS